MTCAARERWIETALAALPGVAGVKADRAEGRVGVEVGEGGPTRGFLARRIEELGCAVAERADLGSLVGLAVGDTLLLGLGADPGRPRGRCAGGRHAGLAPLLPPFVLKAGVPVRWILRARPQDLNGCNNAIQVPALKLQRRLTPGDTVIESSPTKSGRCHISRWMAMITSDFIVA